MDNISQEFNEEGNMKILPLKCLHFKTFVPFLIENRMVSIA